MKKALKLRTFQIGSPAKRGEGLRVGTTRRPPPGYSARPLANKHFQRCDPTKGHFHRLTPKPVYGDSVAHVVEL
jgi:hypothetical protein